MTISKARGALYAVAKALGDLQAATSEKPGAIRRRVLQRLWGRFLGRNAFDWIKR